MTQPTKRRILSFFLVVALFGSQQHHFANASMIRGPKSSKNDEVQVEDYIVMQMEMAWGMKEMSRYMTHRGQWPTRSSSASFDSDEEEGEDDDLLAIIQARNEAKEAAAKARQEEMAARQKQQQEQQQPKEQQQEQDGSRLRRHNQSEIEEDQGFHTTGSSVDDEDGWLIDEEMELILEARAAARTVEEYWDTLVTMF
ncbi:expressed unknown protein [Seminavis robusta]|uniref:Uncharacterized protein n=1 Tax=Seminavis robusta TaxID=568900 RepID=A0A9N8EHQ6_9STRA|nr:expressed unknown protein [Seminavis robusta]|eukprot:Sro953_g224210.1 n/a (198) ;mRNA; f:19451-20044